MLAWLCHTEIVPVGHKRQVEKTDNVCQKCLLVAKSLSGANRLNRKKGKKIKN
jgi:hypothetical protein